MKSIRASLGLLFILFFLLITVSVGVTYWGLRAQAADAFMINLAGRQRMLVQLMTRLAIESQASGRTSAALMETTAAFEETLRAFQTGGTVRYPSETGAFVPAVRAPEIRQQLQQVERAWLAYRLEVAAVFAASAESVTLRQLSTELVTEADRTVRLFQAASRMRIQRLGAVQAGFFAAALSLLIIAGGLVHGNIFVPLKQLGHSAERIRRGDLSTAIERRGLTEIFLLTSAFESMRAELEDSYRERAQWTEALEEKVKERTRELEALQTVSQEISARLDRREVLNSITAKASQLLQAEVALLCLLEPAMDRLGLQAIAGPQETVQQLSSPANNPFVQTILQQPCAQPCQAKGCQGTCGILDDRYRGSHLAAPLVVEDRVIGTLCVGDRRSGAFSEDAPALLTRLASVAAVAIENARLYEQVERLATLEERQRIAAAMHDGLAQMLAALGLLLDRAGDLLETGERAPAAQALETARSRLAQASTEVRQSIADLYEEPGRPKTIQEQLRELIQQQAQEGDPEIDWQIEFEGSFSVPVEDARELLGIARESLANARRHSGASQIKVRLSQHAGETSLWIEDNGRGFDPAAPYTGGRQYFGLKILAARAAQLGGRVSVDSVPGRGTCIALTWPVRKQNIPIRLERKEPQ